MNVLAVLLLAVQTTALPDPIVPNGLGLNVHFRNPSPDTMRRISSAGFRWMRTDLKWDEIEKQPGVYDFSAFESVIESARKNGIRMILILDYGNPLYGGGPPTTTRSREAFASFAAAAVKRYQGRGTIWEIWNEPDIDHFWPPKPNVRAYMDLVKTTSLRIRREFPGETMAGPASNLNWTFFQQAIDHGLIDNVDLVSIHPYRKGPPETALHDVRRVRAMLNWNSPGRVPTVISSEWGYGIGNQAKDEAEQAQYLTRSYLTSLAAGLPVSILYNWDDNPGHPDPSERGFGFVTGADREKVAYTALKGFIGSLAGSKFEAIERWGKDGSYVLRFSRAGKSVRVAWTDRNRPLTTSIADKPIVVDPMPRVL